MEPHNVEAKNARCPECGSRRIDRIDHIEYDTRRRIETIEDTQSIYGLRPMSSQPDRGKLRSGRGGGGLECMDCDWEWRGSCGDADQSPEFQAILASLIG